jgi:hypothetical protein
VFEESHHPARLVVVSGLIATRVEGCHRRRF